MRIPFPTLVAAATAIAGGCGTPGAPGPSPPSPSDVSGLEVVEGHDFVVYGADGRRLSLEEVVASLDDADVLLLGEEHGDPLTHRLQLELLRRAFVRGSPGAPDGLPEGHAPAAPPGPRAGRALVLSLEMFERDVQGVLDEYLAGLITEEHFLASARPWNNYARDYRPLVEFARVHGVPVVAANAPRRYVNRVSRLGAESLGELPDEARRTLPPLPYPGPSDRYRAQWDSLMGEAAAHVSPGALQGQALWDAAMGEAIAAALERLPGALVVHAAGSFHVERGTGIPETLSHYRPGARALAVVFRPDPRPGDFDPTRHLGYGDVVVLVRERPSR